MFFFYFAVVGALTPYWGVYLKSLGYSSQDVGIIGAIILGTRIIAPNFWGWLADKTQKRLRIIRVGSALAFACFAAVLIDQRYSWLVVVISCYTFFWHAVLPQFEVITLGHLDNQYERYSQIRLWGSLGFMISVTALGWLFNYFPVKFLPIAILSFLLLIWLSSLSLGEKQAQKVNSTGKGFLKLISHPAVLCFLTSSFLLQLSHGPYYTFYSLYLKENYGYSSTATGLLWALGVLAEVGIFLLMPKIMRRFTVRTLLLIAFLVAAIRWFLIGCFAQWLVVLLFAQLLHACTFGIAHAASIEFVRNWFKDGNQGQGQALYSSFSFGAGGATGALIGAFIWDYSASFTFLISSAAALFAFIISYFGLHFSEPTKTKPSE
ncbi:MAG: MFS transporter [Chitinophagaceae bacterium]|nr:MAG: MFS transporter [Chitinophagaceae bacterium]